MIFIKFLSLALIAIFSTYIGIIISNKYKNRVIELKEIKKALNIFKTKIKYTYEPLPDIFLEISNNVNKNIFKIFKDASQKMRYLTANQAWNKAVNESKNNMNKEDIDILNGLRKAFRLNRYTRTNKPNRINR